MRKKIVVRGPVLSMSGYGEQTRFALRALRKHEDKFDIYIIPVGWGQTGWLHEYNEERVWFDRKISKTAQLMSSGQANFDMSLQVTIPNEWEKLAPYNIGYTAGIETTKVSPEWIQKINSMDKAIVVSNHSKNIFQNTRHEGFIKETNEPVVLTNEAEIEVVGYPVREFDKADLDINLEYNFNYLTMAQWGPRKNLFNTIKWFVEENFDQEVGLVVKTFIRRGTVIDREHTEKRIRDLLEKYDDRKCKIYLLHGDMTQEEVNSLYSHPKVKAYVSLTHGEGYGLPLFEAAYNGLPVICPGWSGQCDFLYAPFESKSKKKKGKLHPYFAEVEYTLGPIPKEAIWKGVLEEGSMWCYAQEGSYKMRLRQVRNNYDKWKKKANYLQKWILENFKEDDQYDKFVNFILKDVEMVTNDEVDEMFNKLFPAGE
jgi:glycosyltransferase involved in cell wall biosynthesis